MNWYLEMLKQYVISGGQVPSREYWLFTLLAFIIGCVLVLCLVLWRSLLEVQALLFL